MPARATLLGGFLGAGKTTLLNRLIAGASGERLAVLVNDFGPLGIDASLVVGVTDGVVELANGCICCTLDGELVEQVRALLRREPPPERLWVELSGVSDPGRVARTFTVMQRTWPVDLDGVVVVVDAESFPAPGEPDEPTALDQVAAADLVVLSKEDLLGAAPLDAMTRRLRARFPWLRVLRPAPGPLPTPWLVGSFPVESPARDAPSSPHPGLETHAWRSDRPLSLATLREVVTDLPREVLRAKGVLALHEEPSHRVELQVVGRRARVQRLDPWGARPPQSRVVCIGRELPHAELDRLLDSLVHPSSTEPLPPLVRAAEWLRRALSSRRAPRR